MLDYLIRPIKKDEVEILDEMLYNALFQKEGSTKYPREITKLPVLQVYIENFLSKPDDYSFVAVCDNKIIGAVWIRMLSKETTEDFIDDKTPTLSVSVLPEYRRNKIGFKLINEMFNHMKQKGYHSCGLGVYKDNSNAVDLYKKLGCEILLERENDYLMVKKI